MTPHIPEEFSTRLIDWSPGSHRRTVKMTRLTLNG